jgi:hypothetical protein
MLPTVARFQRLDETVFLLVSLKRKIETIMNIGFAKNMERFFSKNLK